MNAMRGIWAKVTGVVVAMVVLAVAVVVATTTTVVVDGSAGAVEGPPPRVGTPTKDVAMDPIAGPIRDKWKVDAVGLFGTGTDISYARIKVLAAKPGMVAVALTGSTESVAAVNPDTGANLWTAPAPVKSVEDCVFSRDGRLGCLTSAYGASPQLTIIDDAGRVVTAKALPKSEGSGKLHAGGDGFLVTTASGSGRGGPVTLNWFASDGARTWSVPTAGKGTVSEPLISQSGNIVLVVGDHGVSAYSLDHGMLLYDAAPELRRMRDTTVGEAAAIRISAVAHGAGFAIGFSTNSSERILFFNSTGHRVGELKDYSMPSVETEGDRIPVARSVSYSNRGVGVVLGSTGKIKWEQASDGSSYGDLEIFGSQYLVSKDYDNGRYTWTVFDLESGTRTGVIGAGTYQEPVGTDGGRLIYEGRRTEADPYPGGLAAYDVRTGREAWWLPVPGYEVDATVVGPYLFRAENPSGKPATVARIS
ncbi:PQQ-binding-like beta-propeller repeat protein [Gordonia sp. ABSL1-1]|uniref:outer membrane protein assembly factor BamB family protein n=1 Tax=Gordonia sp. ABSL1-1 TaxID=3053923 RepID=UPI0025746953|nr:PQQ-binding-like beta-propeller repeat protein [Gordonia sp. ABSL1-1]MDL9937343.1 PQQ-binding-like beta-propeller repeat protein [Gordonia sp. ABSL1-1]